KLSFMTTRSSGGNVDIYIDGVLKASKSLRTTSTKYQQLIYGITGLTNTSHTIKIVATNTSFVNVDYIRYLHN
ncbi:MAG: hypothetical protein WC677_05580, partial [Clostridia bacterium]